MDTLTLIVEAEQAGLNLRVDGDRLVVTGPKEAESIVQRLAEHKAAVLSVIASDDYRSHWTAEARSLMATCPNGDQRSDLHDLFEETAATLEFDQGLSRQQAEMQAFGQLNFRMLQLGLDVRCAK